MNARGRWMLLLLMLFLGAGFAHADNAGIDMKKLVNYRKMNNHHKTIYIKQREAQFRSWAKNDIPENFRIPVELQSYRNHKSIRYYVIYNPGYKTGIGYVPSNLTQMYEEEAWQAFQEYGSDAPSLSIVLAQQFTESAFNPYAIGDNNMSRGLPQLYKKTAEYLYRTDKPTWEQMFYFDKYGNHHFHNTRAMVKFPFVFLPKVKKYDFNNKFEGIRRYNGAGEQAIKYAQKIMLRSLFYEELFAQYNAMPLDTTGFKENLFGMINLTLLTRDEAPLDHALMDDIFENTLAEFYSGYIKNTYLQHYMIPVFEGKPMLVNQPEDHTIPVNGKDYYLIVEDGRTLYSYFKEPQLVLSTINHPKNSPYYIYTKTKGQITKVTNLRQVGKKEVFTNVRPGDKIYIPPGTVIRSPKLNLAVMIQ